MVENRATSDTENLQKTKKVLKNLSNSQWRTYAAMHLSWLDPRDSGYSEPP